MVLEVCNLGTLGTGGTGEISTKMQAALHVMLPDFEHECCNEEEKASSLGGCHGSHELDRLLRLGTCVFIVCDWIDRLSPHLVICLLYSLCLHYFFWPYLWAKMSRISLDK